MSLIILTRIIKIIIIMNYKIIINSNNRLNNLDNYSILSFNFNINIRDSNYIKICSNDYIEIYKFNSQVCINYLNKFNESFPSIAYYKKQIYLPMKSLLLDHHEYLFHIISIEDTTHLFVLFTVLVFRMIEINNLHLNVSNDSVINCITINHDDINDTAVADYISNLIKIVNYNYVLSQNQVDYMNRLGLLIYRDCNMRSYYSDGLSIQSTDMSALDVSQVKPLPSMTEGLTVYEFFSGIGGMRLALPDVVRGIPIKRIEAFDCSEVANDVYHYNFHNDVNSYIDNYLHRILIDGLKFSDVDGKADIWTMSPPCQPYTTTKGANRKDNLDNRSRGIFHIMKLLKEMKYKPRYIILENVQGFKDSKVLEIFKSVLIECNYSFHQYLLSPISCEQVLIPNHRMRYYLTAEHNKSFGSNRFTSDIDVIHSTLPIHHVASITNISNYILSNLSNERKNQLLIPINILKKPWAVNRLSIVRSVDQTTYCFTKSYGRIYDKSSGSCYLEDQLEDIDRKDLTIYYGRIRLFDPDELLAISGFPHTFQWPPSTNLLKRYACIGNSINVTVVRYVMKSLFELPTIS